MKKRPLNPPLNVGDKIELYHMEGENSIPLGTEGVVVSLDNDPFDRESKIIYVKWDNGSSLSLCSDVDSWKMARGHNIEEQIDLLFEQDSEYNFFRDNEEIFDLFDYRFLKKYLKVIQKTGIVNMFASAPLLYCGEEHLDRYYGEDREDDENFQEALEMADMAKNKMIQGTVNWLESKNKEVTVDNANSYIRRLSVKIVELYVAFY
jgi:hypothetical protein